MRDLLAALAGLLLCCGLATSADAADSRDAFGFTFTSIDGEPLPLAEWRGKALLVVNTASFCGYTGQYAELQAVWERYRDRGFVLLGVPSNDFNQETGSNADVKAFCETNFAIDFPMAEKVHVRGAAAHPLFVWLRRELGDDAGPAWNFYKFLVAPDGRAVASWSSSTEPDAPVVTQAIEQLLPKAGS